MNGNFIMLMNVVAFFFTPVLSDQVAFVKEFLQFQIKLADVNLQLIQWAALTYTLYYVVIINKLGIKTKV